MGIGQRSNIFWGAGADDFAAVFSGFRADIDEIIRCFDDIEIVFDNNN